MKHRAQIYPNPIRLPNGHEIVGMGGITTTLGGRYVETHDPSDGMYYAYVVHERPARTNRAGLVWSEVWAFGHGESRKINGRRHPSLEHAAGWMATRITLP